MKGALPSDMFILHSVDDCVKNVSKVPMFVTCAFPSLLPDEELSVFYYFAVLG